MKSEEVNGLLEQDSIRFNRSPLGTSGELSFQLKGRHSCRVDYWAENPNGKPSPGSPMTANCPNDGLSTTMKLNVEGITVGVPLSFRIIVWPKALNAFSGFALEFKESQDLAKALAANIVIARYVGPRNANEIYTYQFANTTSLAEVMARLSASYSQKEATQCTETGAASLPPYPRLQSADDSQKRPLHGLSEVSTDGFGRATAAIHPFFSTRLMQFYESVERQQNWLWNFKWEGQAASFESFPPGYLANLSYSNAEVTTVIKNRLLGNVLPTVDAGPKSFRLTPSILYPTEMSRFELTIKTADASKTLLRCQYTIDQESLGIPDSFYQKLVTGEYLATLVLETNQVHFREGASYPPWLITAQDWIHFKINKKM